MSVFNLSAALAGVRALVGRYGLVIWGVLIVAGIVLFVSQQRGILGDLAGALADAQPGWLVALAALQLVAIGWVVATYKVILRRLGHELDHPRLTLLHLQRHIAGTITPVGGPASAYVFVRGLACRAVPTDDGVLVLALRGVSGYAAFVTTLIPALLIARPSPLMLGAAGCMALMLLVMLAGLILLLGSGPRASGLQRRLPERVATFTARSQGHGILPRDLAVPFLFALALNMTGAAMLYVSLQALGQNVSPTTALAAFAVGNLFTIVAPVFQGVGFVEVSVVVTLERFGIPGSAALAATLLYRLADIWLPLGLGLLAQAGQYRSVRRAGMHLGGLATGVGAIALFWLVAPVNSHPSGMLLVMLATALGLAGAVIVHAPWRSRAMIRLATAGIAASAAPILLFSELNQVTFSLSHLALTLLLLLS